MLYPPTVVEQAMKVQEVIVRAMSGELPWLAAADILGWPPPCSARPCSARPCFPRRIVDR